MNISFEVIILIGKPEFTMKEFDELLAFVSSEKREKIKSFYNYNDAQNALLGDILTRTEICRITGFNNKLLEFSTNDYGKPYLSFIPNIHFNLSHTGYYVALAVDVKPVGIDIEVIQPIDLKIAERFFSADEADYVLCSSHNLAVLHFYEIWTKKESYCKWRGDGLLNPLSSFSVLSSSEFEAIYYHQVFHNKDVIAHVCTAREFPPNVYIINKDTLLKRIKYLL